MRTEVDLYCRELLITRFPVLKSMIEAGHFRILESSLGTDVERVVRFSIPCDIGEPIFTRVMNDVFDSYPPGTVRVRATSEHVEIYADKSKARPVFGLSG